MTKPFSIAKCRGSFSLLLLPLLLAAIGFAPPRLPLMEIADKPDASTQPLRYRWKGTPYVYHVRVESDLDDHLDIREGDFILETATAPPRSPANMPKEHKVTGSGFVVNADGYLLTCAHVVADAT